MQSAESALLLRGEKQMYRINPSKIGRGETSSFHFLTQQCLNISQLCKPEGMSRQQLVASVPASVTSNARRDKHQEGTAPSCQMCTQLEGGLPPSLSAEGSRDRAQSP